MTGACSQQAVKDASHCQLANSGNIDSLFAQVSDRLQDSQCHYYFNDYRDQLLAAAKGTPGPENEARFASLLRSSIELGIISRRQGQAFFGSYFDPEFYSVKAEPRNSCSALRNKDDMYEKMRLELSQKRAGMLDVLANEERFHQAQRHYSDLQLVLDAVELACSEDV
jgi:hypothetical protein